MSLRIDPAAASVRMPRRADPDIRPGTFICLGLDVHAAQITAVRQIDRSLPQPAQRFTPDALLAWVAKMVSAGARVVSCYEAGCFGYVLHRRLEALGVHNLVVAPEAWSGAAKTDKRDARELCLRLERWHSGNTCASTYQRTEGERPNHSKTRRGCEAEGNCVAARRGGEQPGASRPVRNASEPDSA